MSFIINSSVILLFGILVRAQFEGDSCVRKYDNSPGTCKSIRNCPKAREEYKVGVPIQICAYLSGQPVICCPEMGGTPAVTPAVTPDVPTRYDGNQKRVSIRKCENYAELTKEKIYVNPLALGSTNKHVLSISKCDSTTPLIVGGEKTRNGEYPHMAAIGWGTLDGTLEFKCGGSLISERFVLTVAHCGRADGSGPSIVRLGDQNLKSQADGLTEVDIQIEKFIKHENYRRSSHYDDIAVIKMARDVEFTKYIRPACLWQAQDIPSASTVATGWGYTQMSGQTSDELLKVELNIIGNKLCDNFYQEQLDEGIRSTQMCAGVLTGSKDTCNGDSGGPIQITTPENKCLFYIIGITSFGSSFCGAKDSPGVYTRVSSYINWIEEKVWG